jgi:anti-sigma factor RsiW
MSHPTTDRLEAYVEGLLDDGERAVVESHLLSCAPCQHEVDEWLALFAAISDLPELEPSPNFADRIMVHVRISPKWAWQEQAARASAMIAHVLPKTTFGWGLATAFLALPMLLGGGLTLWLLSRPNVSVVTLWSFLSSQITDGARAFGAAAVSTVMQADIVAWVVAQGAALLSTAGTAGLGAVAATAAITTMLSIWVLYRNLFRTPSRNSNYALFSF